MAEPCSRRELLATAAVAGMALPAAGLPRRRSKIRKALKYGMIQAGGSVLERFELIRDVGFDGVELDSPSNLDPDEILAAKAATGIEIPGVVDSVHWGDTLSDPDAAVRARGRAGLETALRQCKLFGGTSVLLVPAVVNKQVSYDQAWRRSTDEIHRVLPLAEDLGVSIAFENVWNNFLLSPLEAARYVDQFGSSRVGFHFDIGNIVLYGWPEQWVRILGSRILKLDVKEYSRKKLDEEGRWKGFQVGIGDGDCDWPAVRAALEEIGYEGWAAAEVGGGGRERLADISARMDRALDG
ncbi:MAG TPA: sugar phosphate isomerase/epimerase family protein [Planctomycetota bacterium]